MEKSVVPFCRIFSLKIFVIRLLSVVSGTWTKLTFHSASDIISSRHWTRGLLQRSFQLTEVWLSGKCHVTLMYVAESLCHSQDLWIQRMSLQWKGQRCDVYPFLHFFFFIIWPSNRKVNIIFSINFCKNNAALM